MAEILGVAASAIQLSQACLSVLDMMKKMKRGRSTLKKYREQLQELETLSTSISESELLQTPEIGAKTNALLLTIKDNCLASLQTRRRLSLAFDLWYREQDIIDIFVDLERQKSSLSLTIELVQSKALSEIQTDIRAMSPPRNQSTCSRGITSTTTSDDQFSSLPGPSNDSTNTRSMGTYNNPVAGPGFNQVNGVMFCGSGPLSKELAKNKAEEKHSRPTIYNHPLKAGDGTEHNGGHFVFEGDITDATLPDLSGHVFFNPQAVSGPSAGPGDICYGTQYNGIHVSQRQ
ncbi:hypothetical protein FOXG_22719 [Fusarium oxysporum f. sp. lycopersici 4287]|uniref:Fungal N-terminal domain-containing protein n=1 Tax=Fusarium oxysporum f. sp. lycopersici (strain 4287 / CBS 123668 / FGSC 9935 / NRRL 34936) TaxID=426428 RepID=A0A0J9WAW1_FUSO4|nr:hypothetical protein FOXG_22719 [Fusarium oxysporum f. sp. lycopersici 4287]EWZ78915.1 hypothetical protein FOWG_16920 [Fusarium oxysporum f. sp. lycopersici MN25]KAJ9413717.1 hypothetical protein QL093DRAFT_2594711 [Fusarium oxysporum]KNB20018.1 hypothetical protein FOXG_22719 [Fusarium oxysporum f. sp. lycopersici 4287]